MPAQETFDVHPQLLQCRGRTMTRVAVTLLVLLSMAVSHNRAFAAEPQRPVKKVQGFGSPTEAWEAFVKAGEARDWGSVYDCFTPVAQDKMTFDCLLGLKFGVAWFNLEKSDDKELRALADNCDKLYAAHGIDWKRIEKESEKAEKKDLDREDLQQLLLPLVRDKRQFFVDATTFTITVQETIGKKMEAKGMKAQPEKKVKPEETPPPGLDKLVKLKIRGDRATAEITHRLPDSTILELSAESRFATKRRPSSSGALMADGISLPTRVSPWMPPCTRSQRRTSPTGSSSSWRRAMCCVSSCRGEEAWPYGVKAA